MYSMLEAVEHGLQHYSTSSPTSFLHGPPPPLTSTTSILNLSAAEFSIATVPSAADQQQQHQYEHQQQSHEYKTEPSTPSCTTTSNNNHHEAYSSFPTPFTPSPSSSGCESPNTPGPAGYSFFPSSGLHEVNGSNNTGDRITISFPVPTTTPPHSARPHSQEVAHVQQLHHHHTHHSSNSLGGESLEAKQQCSFTDEQVDCICDNLQQRMDVEMLGKFLLLAVGAFVTKLLGRVI